MINNENKAGLFFTIIVHLMVVIVLLCMQINTIAYKESSFVLDFTREDEIERQLKEQKLKEDVSKELDKMLKEARNQERSKIRNIAVDAGEKLKDDRGANDVYDQARELQRKLDASKNAAMASKQRDNDAVDLGGNNKKQDNSKKTAYKGPSVVSYTLDGRKAKKLAVPAYQCYGGGDVYVTITVNKQGRVVEAKVIEELSEPDDCLHKYAIRAAKLSIFTASSDAPIRQTGEIVYRFIEQ